MLETKNFIRLQLFTYFSLEEAARTLLRAGVCGLSGLQQNHLPNIPHPPPTSRPRPRRFANGVLLRQRTLSSEPPVRGADSYGDHKVRLKPEWRASRRNSGISSLTGRYETLRRRTYINCCTFSLI